MKYRKRIYYTETDKALMWDRWQKGESLQTIAQLFNRNHSSIAGVLSRTGGIRPPKRTRCEFALSLSEREEISRGIVAGRSIRSIAVMLSRSPSTVSREISRNGGLPCYRANEADQAAWDRSQRPKTCKLVQQRALARMVAIKLKKLWSPVQTASGDSSGDGSLLVNSLPANAGSIRKRKYRVCPYPHRSQCFDYCFLCIFGLLYSCLTLATFELEALSTVRVNRRISMTLTLVNGL
jgi:hypothetical protein